MSKELSLSQSAQYVGPYRLEKTLGKGQTGERTHTHCRMNNIKLNHIESKLYMSLFYIQDWSNSASTVLRLRR